MMAKFGKTSMSRLETCHPDLQRVMLQAIQDHDFTIVWGYRNEAQQTAIAPAFTTKPWPESNHNVMRGMDNILVRVTDPAKCYLYEPFSLAVDVAPWYKNVPHIRWNLKEDFILLAGHILGVARTMNVAIRWGGDWNRNNSVADESFLDLGHFELLSSAGIQTV